MRFEEGMQVNNNFMYLHCRFTLYERRGKYRLTSKK